MKKSLNYKTSEINRNFRIKVSGRDENGKRINKLVGVAGAISPFMWNEIIIKPIKTHKIQKELMSQGYPKPDSYKKYIWFNL